MHIYVGNLPPEFNDADLRSMFEAFGAVRSANIGQDKKTGTSEGYGIVEMPVKREARAAIDGLRGKEIQGKPLRVRILKLDDPFHTAGKTGGRGFSGGGEFRGDGTYRGSGAVRRGGQRGS